ncbi:MAG: hydroxymethylbilane synthase [Rhodospirillales bacterium]|nr:hydroxymethylbilane synthase [Rhodospirillales bacterium]
MTRADAIKLGTRGSPLALAQAHEVRDLLVRHHPELAAPGAIEIIEIKTTGDQVQDRALSEVGGKGLFSKEIDAAQRDGRIDIAVHSMKDLETHLAPGLELIAVLEREDVRDVFISKRANRLDLLPAGSVVGTSSLRRQAQILHRRPDLEVCLFRGNVQTRLRKLDEGEADATLLALAGLNRLGKSALATEILAPEVLLPAVAQGAIGITCRLGDTLTIDRVRALNHEPTLVRISAERALLAALDGSCRTPVGGLAEFQIDGRLRLRALVAKADGSAVFETERMGPAADGEAMGRDAGAELKRRAGPDIFS